jgi:CTP-dependent riboflavin kinase
MEDRDEEGKFNKQYPDEEFLSAVRNLPVASTQNVANEVGCSYDLAYRRLKYMERNGEINKEEVGSSFVWVSG